jgi:hypothetical protein
MSDDVSVMVMDMLPEGTSWPEIILPYMKKEKKSLFSFGGAQLLPLGRQPGAAGTREQPRGAAAASSHTPGSARLPLSRPAAPPAFSPQARRRTRR